MELFSKVTKIITDSSSHSLYALHKFHKLKFLFFPSPVIDTQNMKNCKIHLQEQIEGKSIYSSPIKRCLRNHYKDILLIIVYHYPYYGSIPTLETLYKDAFPNIVFCGPKEDLKYHINVVDIQNGLLSYQCMGDIIKKHPGYSGYLYINDDMIVNWWNFADISRDVLWQGGIIVNGHPLSESETRNYTTHWNWYHSNYGINACRNAIKELSALKPMNWNPEKLLDNLRHNGNGKLYCSKGWSDLFYIPARHAEKFAYISSIFYRNNVFLEIAVTTLLRLLDRLDNTVKLDGHYLPDYGAHGSKAFWEHYRTSLKFIHPFKLHIDDFKDMNSALLRNWVVKYGQEYTRC